MEKYRMTGTVESVSPVQLVGVKGMRKREAVLVDDPNAERPHRLVWELTQDRVNALNESHVGSKVTVDGWPESRSWSDKMGNVRWFTSMRLFSATVPEAKIELTRAAAAQDGQDGEEIPF